MNGNVVFSVGMGILFIAIMLVALFGQDDKGVSRGFWGLAAVGCIVGIVGCLMIGFT